MTRLVSRSLTILFVGGALVCAGCSEKTASDSGRTADTGVIDTSGTAPSNVEAKTYTFHGVPTAIDTARREITINHEKIEGFMDPMTMPFQVADPALLTQATVGKRSRFTIRVAGWEMTIMKIEPEEVKQQ